MVDSELFLNSRIQCPPRFGAETRRATMLRVNTAAVTISAPVQASFCCSA